MAVELTEIAMTKEGLENLATLAATGIIRGQSGTIDFKIGYFQLGSYGESGYSGFSGYKTFRDSCEEVYYLNYTASGVSGFWDARSGIDPYFTDMIAVNSVDYVDPLKVEINCYVAPAQITGAKVWNEIMVFTGEGTSDNPYESFMYGIFPSVTKQDDYGLNFRVTCQF